MTGTGWLRTTRSRVALAVGCSLLLGVVGLALVVEGFLLAMPLPLSARGRAWRTLGLIAFSTGVVAGLVAGLVAVVAGYPFVYAGLAGAAAGLAGLGLGSLAGLVVSVDGYRREVHAA